MTDFNAEYKNRIKMIDDYMKACFEKYSKCEPEIYEAMQYSVFNGGKRIRSVLCVETAKMLSGNIEKALPFAAAIEFIHAFSLVHDDLPCMDNADTRRGLPSCHKKYGEAMALLAGDALLNTAFEIMAEECEKEGKTAIRAMRHIASAVGISGMINGQVKDIKIVTKEHTDESDLISLIEQKTMALIMTGIISGAYVSGADDKTVSVLNDFAYNFGIAFQIRDDFEDEAEDMAEEQNSPNFINILGRETAEKRLSQYVLKARDIISEFENNEFLKGLIDYLFD